MRTGFSEAMATDLEDDSYDLSWYRELSGDDITDIKKLRAMLGTENEAIDRHYMLSERYASARTATTRSPQIDRPVSDRS